MKKTAGLFVLILIINLFMVLNVAMADTLVLPEETVIIETEAFYGTNAEIIVVPQGATTIGDRAFGGSTMLQTVVVPEGLMDREADALEGSPNAKFVHIGFMEADGYTYYWMPDGQPLKGLQNINGHLYLFESEDGYIQTGWRTVDEHTYYFDPENYYALTGFSVIGNSTYYFDEEGQRYENGYYEIGSAEYYFDNYGILAKGFRIIDDTLVLFDEETGELFTGIYTDPVSHYRFYYDGRNGMVKSRRITIDGAEYYCYASGVMARGLTTINGKKYYFDWETGKRVTGLTDIGMNHYMFFGEDGAAKSGIIDCNGTRYYFDVDNKSTTAGFITFENNTYYFSPDTYAMVTGFVRIDGDLYYLDTEGKLQTGLVTVNGEKYLTDKDGKIKTGLFVMDGIYYKADEQTGKLYTGFYKTPDDNLTYYYEGANGRVTGKQQIAGEWYLFGENGIMKYGFQTIGGVRWFFDPDTGKAENGFVQYYGYRYLVKNGIVQCGMVERDGSLYWLSDGTGYAKTGFQRGSDSALYYFDNVTYAALTGWQEIGGYMYFFGEDGKAYSDGIYEINGGKYYFSVEGVLQKGWRTINGASYYFSLQTGKMVTGLLTLDGYTYYFTENGLAKGLQTINGKVYLFDDTYGIAQTGYRKIGEDIYIFDAYTKQGITGSVYLDGWTYYLENGKAVRSGLRFIDGTAYMFDSTYGVGWKNTMATGSNNITYYFDKYGANMYGMVTYNNTEMFFYKNGGYASEAEKASIVSQMASAANGFVEIGEIRYYKENGTFVKGFKKIDGNYYYFSETNGAMLTGLRLIDGYYYYFGNDGKRRTGSVILERGECWFGADGKMLTGKNGSTYYSETGQMIDGYIVGQNNTIISGNGTSTGFVSINGNKYYFMNGVALTGMQEIAGKTYSFTSDGIMRTGLVYEDGKALYFDQETGERKIGFVKVGNEVYYFDEISGKLTGIQNIGGDWYYFDGYGILTTGEVTVGSDVYYFDEKTGKMKSGIIETSFGKVYADPSTGKLQSGFIKKYNNGHYDSYYFHPSFYTMATGWLSIGDCLYYFNSDGVQQSGFTTINDYTFFLYEDHMATGLTEIDNHEYFFDKSGAMLTGWVIDGDKNYYFDSKTGQRIIGVVKYGEYYFGFLRDGSLGVGAVTFEDGREYYFDENHKIAVLGLRSFEDGKLHYYDLNEGMYRNRTWTMDGIRYTADENGVVRIAEINSTFAEILNDGFQYLGTPYGSFDGGLVCSTFVAQVLNDTILQFEYNEGESLHMYSMFRDSYPDYISYDKTELELGDIIFYINENCDEGNNCEFVGEIHHVGFYIGNGKIMEATPLPGEQGYTLVRDLVESNQYPIAAIIHTLQIADHLE